MIQRGIEQADFRIPATGEGWRRQSGGPDSLFTIIGMAHDVTTGAPMVVYTHYEWRLVQLPPIYVCVLSEFTALVPDQRDERQFQQRFKFEREPEPDPRCPFIRPQPTTSFKFDSVDVRITGDATAFEILRKGGH